MKFFGIFLIVALTFVDTYSVSIRMIPTSYETLPQKQQETTFVISEMNDKIFTGRNTTLRIKMAPGKRKDENMDKAILQHNNLGDTVKYKKIHVFHTTLYFKTETTMPKIVRNEHDKLITCQRVRESVSSTLNGPVLSVSDEVMSSLMSTCRNLNKRNRRKRQLIIYPGTKWCGMGNIAANYDDLGSSMEADKCCRTHDSCPEGIGPFESKYELFNAAIWYKSHCKCDQEFYDCLKTANTEASNTIGTMYFNIVSPQCIKKVFPEVCVEEGLFGVCVRYKKDKTKEKIWAFKDNELIY